MARRKKKTPIKIRSVDEKEYSRLVRNAKNKIKRTQDKFGIDITDKINIPDLKSFKTRKEFNSWKDDMEKLRYRADITFKNVDGAIASVSQINQSKKESNILIKKLDKVKGKRNTYVNKHGVEFTKSEVEKMNLQTNIARDMEIEELNKVSNLPYFTAKHEMLSPAERTRKITDETKIAIRQKFDPQKAVSNTRKREQTERLEKVSKVDRYDYFRNRLKENQMSKIMQVFGNDAEDVLLYFQDMDDMEFTNFFYYFQKTSMGFELYSSDSDMEDVYGFLEQMRTDIEFYEKNKDNIKAFKKF